jgi:hypothetical protein
MMVNGWPALGRWLDRVRRELFEAWQGLVGEARPADRQDAVPVLPAEESGDQAVETPPPMVAKLEAAEGPWRLLRVVEQTGFSFDVALGGVGVPSAVTVACYRLEMTPGMVEWRGELLVLGRVEGDGEMPAGRVPATHRHRLPAGSEQWRWSYPQVRLEVPAAGGPVAQVSVEGYRVEPVLLPLYHAHDDALKIQGERPLGAYSRDVVLSTPLPLPADGVVKSEATPRSVALQAGNDKVIAHGRVDKITLYTSGGAVRQHAEEVAFTESWSLPGVLPGDVIEAVNKTARVTDSWERGQLRQQVHLSITVALYRPEFREIAASPRPHPAWVPVLARVQVGQPLIAHSTWEERADGPGQVLDVELQVRSVEAQVGERQVGLSGSAFQRVLYVGADGLVHFLERRTRFHQAVTCENASPDLVAHLRQVRPSGVRLAGCSDVRWQVRVELEFHLSCERVVYVPGPDPAVAAAPPG